MTHVKYALFTLLFLAAPIVTFCQNIFQVYDNYTLEIVDSLEIHVDNKKVLIKELSGGIFTIENGKKGDKVTIENTDYCSSYYYLTNNRKSVETIMLEPTKLKLEEYKKKLPYYQEYTLDEIRRDFPDSSLFQIDSLATFPGGKKELYDYLRTNINYPEIAIDLDIEGKVLIRFVVEEDGSMARIGIINSVNQPMDAEAYRVIQNMPKWNPATYKGEPTKSIFYLPVAFKLE